MSWPPSISIHQLPCLQLSQAPWLQVFVTDTAALRTCLLADVGAPVLDLQLGSGDVWVGTTDSEVTCWQLPNSAPDQDVVIHNVSNDTDGAILMPGLPCCSAALAGILFADD